jgi:phosphatidylglycerophosphate synthase
MDANPRPDCSRGPRRRVDLPNAVTVFRYAGSVVFVLCASGPPLLAFALIAVVYATDLLDGWLARRSRSPRSPTVGRILDSSADSFTFVMAFLALWRVGAAPLWIMMLVALTRAMMDVTRSVAIISKGPYPSPTRLTKFKGIIYSFGTPVMFLAATALSSSNFLNSRPIRATEYAVIVLTTLIACGHFFRRNGHYLADALYPRR